MQYPDARHTLCMEVLFAGLLGVDDPPVRDVLDYCATLQPGRKAVTFGFLEGERTLSAHSKAHPRIHMAIQYVVKTHFKESNVVAVRLGRSIQRLPKYKGAARQTIIYWTSDESPDFHMVETDGQEVTDLPRLTGLGLPSGTVAHDRPAPVFS